jgi:hypothetical protein
MKTISAIVSFLVIAASVLSAQAAKTTTSTSMGQWTSVSAASLPVTNCLSFTIYVDASESSTRDGGTTYYPNRVQTVISAYDSCTNENFSGIGYTTFEGFPSNWVKKFGKPLTLNLGTVNACHYPSNRCLPLSGSVTITPTSDYSTISTCRGTETYNSPHLVGTIKTSDTIRFATAKATINVSSMDCPFLSTTLRWPPIFKTQSTKSLTRESRCRNNVMSEADDNKRLEILSEV